MAGGKLSPRQKMINMMYLVLTALLALNVSKEVLDAFVVVNVGLLQQRNNLDQKNSGMYTEFDNQVTINKTNERVKRLNTKALEVGKLSKELSDFIQQMKIEVLVATEGVDEARAAELAEDPAKVGKKDDYDKPTHYFGTSNPPGENGKANELKTRMAEFREKLMAMAEKPEHKSELEKSLSLLDPSNFEPDEEDPTWEMKYFYHLPLSAALTELTKWQNIVKGAESSMLTYFWDQISAQAFKFDAVEAKIIPKSTFVVSGGNFEAEVFLAAYSTSQKPKIIVGTGVDSTSGEVVAGAELSAEQIVNGKGLLKIPASGAGERTIGGVIELTDPTGQVKKYAFATAYNVSPPSATVAPTKMNVFYVGLENPLSVSVPGVAPNNISVTCSNGSLSGSGGNYIVKPSGGNECTITVSAKMPDGTSSNMGAHKFRVKQVPDPVLKWNSTYTSGGYPPSLGGQPVIPEMKDFDFEVFAKVSSMIIGFSDKDGNYKEYTMNSNVPSSECASAIGKLPRGRKVFVDAKVTVPGGQNRPISGIWTMR